MEIGWNLMISDKRSGDILATKLLVSHGRPHKPAFFITIHTDYIDASGVVSPLQRVVLNGLLIAQNEKEFPLKKSHFPLALLWNTPGSFLSSRWPPPRAGVLPALAQQGKKVSLAATTSDLGPRVVLAQEGAVSSCFPSFSGYHGFVVTLVESFIFLRP